MIFLVLLLDVDAQDGFDRFFRSFHKAMWSYAYKITRDSALADDVVQRAFLNLIGRWDAFLELGDQERKAYAIITTRNLSLKELRRAQKLVYLDDADAIQIPAFRSGRSEPESIFEATEDYRHLYTLLGEVTPILKDAVCLRHLYGYSYTDIAELMGVKIGTARKRVERGLNQVRGMLADETATHQRSRA